MAIELQCLLLTRDSGLLEMVDKVLQPLGIGLEIRTESASALEIATRRHLDGFVLDCDDVPGARELLSCLTERQVKWAIATSGKAEDAHAGHGRFASFKVTADQMRQLVQQGSTNRRVEIARRGPVDRQGREILIPEANPPQFSDIELSRV